MKLTKEGWKALERFTVKEQCGLAKKMYKASRSELADVRKEVKDGIRDFRKSVSQGWKPNGIYKKWLDSWKSSLLGNEWINYFEPGSDD
jgi:hypothetical protein